MTRNSKLDINIHWQTVSPKIKIPKVKATNYPVKLKDMIDPEVYHQDEVEYRMTFNKVKEMLTSVVNDEKHFSTGDNYIASFYPEQFMPKTAIYGVLSAEEEIDFELSSQIKINRALKPILSDNNWKQALNSAKKLLKPVRNKKVKATVLGRRLDIVVLVTLGKLIIPKKRKATPTIGPEGSIVVIKKTKKTTSSYFRFKVDYLQIDIFPPIVSEEQSSSKTIKKVPNATGRVSFEFDLTDYIVKGSDGPSDESSVVSDATYDPETPSDNASNSSTLSLPTPGSDDCLSGVFTLSTFRKAVMIAALDNFSDSYKNKVSSASKIYSNVVYNQKLWNEIKSTADLHQLIIKEHNNKSRISKQFLQLRISLGTSSKKAFRDSLDEYFGSEEVMAFSQNQELVAQSPELKVSVSSLRRNVYNRNK